MADGIRVYTSLDFINQQLKDVDKKFGASVKKELRAAVALSGVDLVSAIKSEASWSSRIPGSTSLATTFGAKKASIRIRVDKKKAPHARPLEFGNGRGASGVLRHPVFHKIGQPGGFASMPTRPFFFAAVNARTPGIDKKFETAIKQIAADSGFKGV